MYFFDLENLYLLNYDKFSKITSSFLPKGPSYFIIIFYLRKLDLSWEELFKNTAFPENERSSSNL